MTLQDQKDVIRVRYAIRTIEEAMHLECTLEEALKVVYDLEGRVALVTSSEIIREAEIQMIFIENSHNFDFFKKKRF